MAGLSMAILDLPAAHYVITNDHIVMYTVLYDV